jgi:hypothetical protein
MVSNLAISSVLIMLVLFGVSLLFETVALVLLRFRRKIAATIVGSVALIFFGLTSWIAAAIYPS